MSDLDLEKGLTEFLDRARQAFLNDPGYAIRIATQAQSLRVVKK